MMIFHWAENDRPPRLHCCETSEMLTSLSRILAGFVAPHPQATSALKRLSSLGKREAKGPESSHQAPRHRASAPHMHTIWRPLNLSDVSICNQSDLLLSPFVGRSECCLRAGAWHFTRHVLSSRTTSMPMHGAASSPRGVHHAGWPRCGVRPPLSLSAPTLRTRELFIPLPKPGSPCVIASRLAGSARVLERLTRFACAGEHQRWDGEELAFRDPAVVQL